MLRYRLEGVETTLSLLDTLADGMALFARLGISISIPLKLLHISRSPAQSTGRSRHFLQKLFERSETLADLFWLLSTLTGLALSEWERREVWSFGKRVRRLMRDEELIRDQMDREIGQGQDSTISREADQAALWREDEERLHRIRTQRRTLRDLRGRLSWLWWERLRLGADVIFASYDVFDLSQGSESVRAIAGAVSAAVGFSQVTCPLFLMTG